MRKSERPIRTHLGRSRDELPAHDPFARYKLIVYPEVRKAQLFDLKNDPLETRDIAGSSASGRRRSGRSR
jgi:hypothetical protein